MFLGYGGARREERGATARDARPLRRMYPLKYSRTNLPYSRWTSIHLFFTSAECHDRCAGKKGLKSDRGVETEEGTAPRLHRTFNYFISYVFYYVSRARASEGASRDVSGRRKVENEKETGRKGARRGKRGGGMGNVKRAEGGCTGERSKTLFPLKGGRHFSPRARWLSCVFCSGVVAA